MVAPPDDGISQVPAFPDGSSPSGSDSRSTSTGWRRCVKLALLVLIAFACFAPYFAGRLIETRGVHLEGPDSTSLQIDVGAASLGWLSPLQFSDVVIRDSRGQPLCRLSRVSSQGSLWQLLSAPHRPGQFVIDAADVVVIVREDGLNVNDALNWLQSQTGGGRLADFSLQVRSGTARIESESGDQLAGFHDLTLDLLSRRSRERQFTFRLTAVPDANETSRPVDLAVEWSGPLEGSPLRSGRGAADLKIAALPVEMFGPLLRRIDRSLLLRQGHFEGVVSATWDFADARRISVQAESHAIDVLGSLATADGLVREFHLPRETISSELQASYDPVSDTLSLSGLTFDSSLVKLASTGAMADVQGACMVDLGGKLSYDLTAIQSALSEQYRDQLTITGLRTRSFSIQGPLLRETDGALQLAPEKLTFNADLSWDDAQAFGVRSQGGVIGAGYTEGTITIEPRNVPVNDGYWRGTPTINVQSDPVTLALPSALVLDNIEFSQELCHQWLRFLSPPMAQAATADGRLSIKVRQVNAPLQNVRAGQADGTLILHSANVRPGPFARRLIETVAAIEALIPGRSPRFSGALSDARMFFPEQNIDFQVANGRVSHSAVVFQIGAVDIRTSGSVGFDESLDLMIEIPLPPEWFKGSFLSESLGGEVLRIPVRGTFDDPQIDRRVLSEFGKRIAARATGGLLKKLLDD